MNEFFPFFLLAPLSVFLLSNGAGENLIFPSFRNYFVIPWTKKER